MSKDNYSEEDVVKSPWMKFNKIGDNIHGTLASVSEREQTNQKGETERVKVYELSADGGEFHEVDDEKKVIEPAILIKEGEMWNVGGHYTFNASMKNIRIGQRIKIAFTESKPSSKAGYSPMKIRKVFSKGEMNEDFLTELEVRKTEGSI